MFVSHRRSTAIAILQLARKAHRVKGRKKEARTRGSLVTITLSSSLVQGIKFSNYLMFPGSRQESDIPSLQETRLLTVPSVGLRFPQNPIRVLRDSQSHRGNREALGNYRDSPLLDQQPTDNRPRLTSNQTSDATAHLSNIGPSPRQRLWAKHVS